MHNPLTHQLYLNDEKITALETSRQTTPTQTFDLPAACLQQPSKNSLVCTTLLRLRKKKHFIKPETFLSLLSFLMERKEKSLNLSGKPPNSLTIKANCHLTFAVSGRPQRGEACGIRHKRTPRRTVRLTAFVRCDF